MNLDGREQSCYRSAYGHVAKLVNATVCKTVIHGFDPHRGLHKNADQSWLAFLFLLMGIERRRLGGRLVPHLCWGRLTEILTKPLKTNTTILTRSRQNRSFGFLKIYRSGSLKN